MSRSFLPALAFVAVGWFGAASAKAEYPVLPLEPVHGASFRFGGVLGERIDANVENWLLRAPSSNPGMLEMFAVRDRQPVPNLVPWAGEFVGKYLISAIQALWMTDDPRLEPTVRDVVNRLVASQAEDGYLGPFPKKDRLLANWDLWGHYHCMEALLMWNERTGDEAALTACRRAADLACKIYLDSGRRPIEAGSDEMNLAFIHGLGMLYRKTKEPRYLALMKEFERDWEKAGDYFRTGLAGTEYFRTPRPRWESLHDLQGLVELHQITGDERYAHAFLNHWHSIRRWDRRNTGGFSSGEQATGHPFTESAIETCCTIAWMAITIDALRLIHDARVADELELATYNAMAGAQHATGRWWTYNTPMDGIREASAHTIVFQARAGTPELNCCSVNGPRGLGMLSEWAVMRGVAVFGSEELIPSQLINYLGAMKVTLPPMHQGSEPVTLIQESAYPLDGKITLKVESKEIANFVLSHRIPAWATNVHATVRGKPVELDRRLDSTALGNHHWESGDEITLSFDMPLRYVAGDEEQLGKISIYRGPILLAYDQADNDFDEDAIPTVEPAMLDRAVVVKKAAESRKHGDLSPWLLVDIPTDDGKKLRLRDFASAGNSGTHYRSWLPAAKIKPPAPVLWQPLEGASVPAGKMLFTWRRPPAADSERRKHTILVSETPDFNAAALRIENVVGERRVLTETETSKLKSGNDYYWTLIATNEFGETSAESKPKKFQIDPKLPAISDAALNPYGQGPDSILTRAALKGSPDPEFGTLLKAEGIAPAEGRDGKPGGSVEFDGKRGMVVYNVSQFPESDYSVALWANPADGGDGLMEIFSAWVGGGSDPLRICIQGGKVYARMEAGGSFSTEGVRIEKGRWTHLAAVKEGPNLTLYIEGNQRSTCRVPGEVISSAVDFALGGNPHFSGPEFYRGRIADFAFYARALATSEVEKLAKAR